MGVEVSLAGEQVELLAERAAWWPARQTLIAADLHWGKEATFRVAGIPIPDGAAADDLERLSFLIRQRDARRLLVLGDLLHARSGARSGSTLERLRGWRARHPDLELVLVRGNHDRQAGDPPSELGFASEGEPRVEAPFVFRHTPADDPRGYVMAGHVHPAVRVAGRGLASERLPAFIIGPRYSILPAFGTFTGTALVHPSPLEAAYVIVNDRVMAVGHGD